MAPTNLDSNTIRRKPLTAERLRELLHYDPETGVFTWISGPRRGLRAGCIDCDGYRRIKIDRVGYRGGSLAWLYMTGSWSSMIVDHKDTDRSNDRFTNLREASCPQNNRNTRIRRNNTSGFKGVHIDKKTRTRWRAYIRHAGRQRHLGYFNTAAEAHAAYCKAALEIDPEFARFA